MMATEEKVYNLVKEQFEDMKFSKKWSNRSRLSNKCEQFIYDNWSVRNDYIWNLVDRYVKEFIPDKMD